MDWLLTLRRRVLCHLQASAFPFPALLAQGCRLAALKRDGWVVLGRIEVLESFALGAGVDGLRSGVLLGNGINGFAGLALLLEMLAAKFAGG